MRGNSGSRHGVVELESLRPAAFLLAGIYRTFENSVSCLPHLLLSHSFFLSGMVNNSLSLNWSHGGARLLYDVRLVYMKIHLSGWRRLRGRRLRRPRRYSYPRDIRWLVAKRRTTYIKAFSMRKHKPAPRDGELSLSRFDADFGCDRSCRRLAPSIPRWKRRRRKFVSIVDKENWALIFAVYRVSRNIYRKVYFCIRYFDEFEVRSSTAGDIWNDMNGTQEMAN